MIHDFQQGKGGDIGGARPEPHIKGGKGNKSERLVFEGCFECGGDGHSRAQCPAWLNILDVSNKPPAGHMGKTDRAYARWTERKAEKAAVGKASNRQGSRMINALGVEAQEQPHTDTESEDDDFSKYENSTLATMFLLHQLVAESDSTDVPAESASTDLAIRNMQAFAHHIRNGKKLSQRRFPSALVAQHLLIRRNGQSIRW